MWILQAEHYWHGLIDVGLTSFFTLNSKLCHKSFMDVSEVLTFKTSSSDRRAFGLVVQLHSLKIRL